MCTYIYYKVHTLMYIHTYNVYMPDLIVCLFNLQCNTPAYSGNGTVCARDSDGDTLPDVGLGCEEIFCKKVTMVAIVYV